MNWLDIVILVMILLSAYKGWKSGFIRSVFLILGILLAALIGARLSEPIASWATNSVENDATATVIAYVVIGAIVFIVVQIIGAAIQKFLKLVFLGFVDKIAGAGLGALTGVIGAGFLIAVLARLAVLVPESAPLAGEEVTKIREGLTNTLVDSAFVPVYLSAEEKLPGNAFGMVPGDFHEAYAELRAIRDARE
ncbi:MAG: CvpA family protein [Chloroflexi bacterium]|nr:CvpA family protein [Chloroflexota bacterium]